MQPLKDKATSILENRKNNPSSGSSENSGSTNNSGTTNSQKNEEAKNIKAELAKTMQGDISKLTTEQINEAINKIGKYKELTNNQIDETLRIWLSDLNNELKDRNEKTNFTPAEGGENKETNNGSYSSEATTGTLGNSNASASHTPDEIIGEAEKFLNQGNGTATINGQNLKDASSTLYNILLSIGIFLAVAIGMYLGIKFMVSNAEDKAKVKEALIPYIVGCVIIFAAFIIWRVAILLLGGIA